MQARYADEDVTLDAALGAEVGALISACRSAVSDNVDLVHVWFA